MSHTPQWDRWNVVMRHSGHGVHESHYPTRTYGPFTSVDEANTEMTFLATHGRIPVTYRARIEAAPLEYMGHKILLVHGGGYMILPYNIQRPTLSDAQAWIHHHVQTTRS